MFRFLNRLINVLLTQTIVRVFRNIVLHLVVLKAKFRIDHLFKLRS